MCKATFSAQFNMKIMIQHSIARLTLFILRLRRRKFKEQETGISRNVPVPNTHISCRCVMDLFPLQHRRCCCCCYRGHIPGQVKPADGDHCLSRGGRLKIVATVFGRDSCQSPNSEMKTVPSPVELISKILVICYLF